MSLASSHVSFMRLLARSHPELWELFHPHEPAIVVGRSPERAFLNPQPLPPKARLAHDVHGRIRAIADAAITASYGGTDVNEMLAEIGDELCPDPPKFKWPKRWPTPWPDEPYPIGPEDLASIVQAEAALVFGGYAADIADESLSRAFGDLADRLVDAATQQEFTLTRD